MTGFDLSERYFEPDRFQQDDQARADATQSTPPAETATRPSPPTGDPTDPANLLATIEAFIRRFVVLTDDQAAALALWVVHTHGITSSDTTPYVGITSAEKRSGKTLLLEVLGLLVREPLPTANISDAALFRAISKLDPTLLFDEMDTIFGPKARDREDLRGLLNAGYRRGAVVWRMGGKNNTSLEPFAVYCAKAFAGIGKLPDTIADRSIRIRLERRTRDEPIERFRRRDVEDSAVPIADEIASTAAHYADRLAFARPQLPDELDDRAQDCWEPLLAIADLAGGDWPQRARLAARALSGERHVDDDSMGARLLADIRSVFDADETLFETDDGKRYKTSSLIDQLAAIEESPWGDWNGRTITPQALSKLLAPYGIRTMPVWVEGKTVRGYKEEQFANAFLRVLGVRTVRGVRSGISSDAAPNAPNAPNAQTRAGEQNGSPQPGDDDYLAVKFAAFEAGQMTEAEWRQIDLLDRLVKEARS